MRLSHQSDYSFFDTLAINSTEIWSKCLILQTIIDSSIYKIWKKTCHYSELYFGETKFGISKDTDLVLI